MPVPEHTDAAGARMSDDLSRASGSSPDERSRASERVSAALADDSDESTVALLDWLATVEPVAPPTVDARHVVNALIDRGEPRVAHVVAERLQQPFEVSPAFARAACEALGRFGEPAAADVLNAKLMDGTFLTDAMAALGVPSAAATAIAQIDGARADAWYLAWLELAHDEVLALAALAGIRAREMRRAAPLVRYITKIAVDDPHRRRLFFVGSFTLAALSAPEEAEQIIAGVFEDAVLDEVGVDLAHAAAEVRMPAVTRRLLDAWTARVETRTPQAAARR
jgi:hypothetical protein